MVGGVVVLCSIRIGDISVSGVILCFLIWFSSICVVSCFRLCLGWWMVVSVGVICEISLILLKLMIEILCGIDSFVCVSVVIKV